MMSYISITKVSYIFCTVMIQKCNVMSSKPTIVDSTLYPFVSHEKWLFRWLKNLILFLLRMIHDRKKDDFYDVASMVLSNQVISKR